MATDANHVDNALVLDRAATARRILITILFAIVVRLIEAVLVLVILFELIASLITRRPPNPRITRFARRILRYGFDIGRYVTFNKDQAPFPFDDLPNGTEPINGGSPAAV